MSIPEITIRPVGESGFIVEVAQPPVNDGPGEVRAYPAGQLPPPPPLSPVDRYAFTTAEEVGAFVADRLGAEGPDPSHADHAADAFRYACRPTAGEIRERRDKAYWDAEAKAHVVVKDLYRCAGTPLDNRLHLVPVEPTEDMLRAGADALIDPRLDTTPGRADSVYRAMLVAAREGER
jgi:phytoene/squalene synthetase